MSKSRTILFNALPEKVRERLVESFTASGPTGPVVSSVEPGASVGWWIFVILCSLGGLAALVLVGLGDLWDSLSMHGPEFIAAYAGLFFMLFYGVLAIVRAGKVKRAFPYQEGRYLFALDLIEARGDKLKLTPMRDLTDFRGVHHHTNGAYTHTLLTFTFEGGRVEAFSIVGKAQAQAVMDSFVNQQKLVQTALQEKRYEVIAALDPLIEARLSDQWELLGESMPPGTTVVGGTLAGRVPAILRWASIPALVLGIAAGGGLWAGRQIVGDDLLFEEARKINTVESFEVYLWRGTRHVKAVKDKYLPEAALAEAKEKGTVLALRDFIKEYPKAKKQHKKARKQIGKLYDKAYKEFKKSAARDNKALLPFMGALLDYLEKHDTPDLVVRFQSPDEGVLKEIDTVVAGKGDVAAVAPYFTLQRNTLREAVIVGGMERGFGAVFPQDILRLSKGAPLTGKRSKKVKEPTIEVVYVVKPSGQIYESVQSKRAFVGIRMDFEVRVRIPKSKKTLDFDLGVEPPERFSVSYTTLDTFGTGGGPSDGQVYDVMAARAFEQLSEKMRSIFFEKGSRAWEDSGRAIKR